MKKIFIKAIVALVCVCCVSMGWTQTKEDNFALLGVELGSLNWGNSKYSNGEILWNDNDKWPCVGWDLTGVDLSKYSGLRLEVNSGKADVYAKIEDVIEPDTRWFFHPDKKGVVNINFNGIGSSYHEGTIPEPNLTKGLRIYFIRDNKKSPNEKTVIKKVELIERSEDDVDYSYLDIMGRRFGTMARNCTVDRNTITWNKGENDFRCGWNLEGVDMSEYSRIKIELEQNELGDFEIELWGKDWSNRHTFFTKSGPNVYVANLTGEGAGWKDENAVPFDLSQGMNIYLFKNLGNKNLSSNKKTVVKSVTLIKDANTKLKEFELLGAQFGSAGWNYYFSEQAEICWEKGKGGECGWNFEGVDLTPYADKKVRIELEYTDIPVYVYVANEDSKFYSAFHTVSPNVFEATFTGKSASWKTKNNDDLSKGLRIVFLKDGNAQTKGKEKTVVKSVSLVDDVDMPPVPERYKLGGVKLGTFRDGIFGIGCYVEKNNVIVWKEKTWNDCGWDLEGIDLTETPVVSIELESTDVPVRITVIQNNSDDGRQYWFEFKAPTSNRIQIDLSKKEAWDPERLSKVAIENKSTKSTFDLSKGAVIYISTISNPTKPGKTTVVKKAELLKEFKK